MCTAKQGLFTLSSSFIIQTVGLPFPGDVKVVVDSILSLNKLIDSSVWCGHFKH